MCVPLGFRLVLFYRGWPWRGGCSWRLKLAIVLSPTENKAGKKVSGLNDFSKDSVSGHSGGAWPIVGGVLSSFTKSCILVSSQR
jgi:hypothetical protein